MLRTLRGLGTVFALLLGALVLSNVLVPAVARAQFAAAGGGSTVDVLTALVGKDVSAKSYTASAASGVSGFACTFNGCRFDIGAGATDYFESNGSTVSTGGSFAVGTGQSVTLRTLGNQGSNPIQSVSSAGFQFFPLSLPGVACGSGNIGEGTLQVVPASSGVNDSKVCVCTKSSAGTFAWRNLVTGTNGTTTTCP